jgi:hypothetical protein
VGDDQRGAVARDVAQRGLDLLLGAGVERAGRLVEDQDARVLEDGARDRDALLLAARELQPALADRCRSPRAGADEVVHLAQPGGGLDDSAWLAPGRP